MDIAPEPKVEDVISHRQRQLGLMDERKARPKSKSKRSKSSPSSSPARSSRSSGSSSSVGSSKSRSRSPKGILKPSKKKVNFVRSKTTPKNVPPTTLPNRRGRGRGRGKN